MAYIHANPPLLAPPRKGEGDEQDKHILREFKRKLTEGYISYFNDRLKIEEEYIRALTKLHERSLGADRLQDDAPHPRARVTSTARRAWYAVRDYTTREIEAREAFSNALRQDVLDPLVALRDTQTRIQNRITEDLKAATGSYEDYVIQKVPKLLRAYRSKTQAVEDFRKQQHAIEMQAKLLAEQMPKEPPESKPHPYSSHGHSPSASSINNATGSWGSGLSDLGSGTPPGPQSATSPQAPQHSQLQQHTSLPLPPGFHSQQPSPISPQSDTRPFERPVESRAIGHGLSNSISGRARSGSGSYVATMQAVDAKSKEVFSDLAAHSKKGFAAIMQRLGGEREGEGAPSIAATDSTLHGLGGGTSSVRRGSVRHNNGAVKSARIKRDAEEADKAYRHGVFHVETLRLRREKLQQSAITSLNQFNDELNMTLYATLRAYAYGAHSSTVRLGQSTEPMFLSFRTVDSNRDKALFLSRLPVVSRYPQIMYDNYYVGKCRSLIFGFRLTDYDFARGEAGGHGRPPLIVEKCISWIDALGNDAEGIYRMSGRQQTVRRLIQDIERNEEAFRFTPEDDVFSVAVVLKAYLRDLPDPLFPLPHAERVKWSEPNTREEHFRNQFATLRGRLRRLPTIHQTTFQCVIEHLNRISNNAAENKMNAANLAVVFNSVLFGQEQMPSDTDALKMHLQKDTVLEDIITNPEMLFPPEGFYGEPQSPSKASMRSSQSRGEYPLQPAPMTQNRMSGPPAIHTPPLHVYATQHPIAAQHVRASSDEPGSAPRTPQLPISFQPPSHTSTGQHISPPQPPMPPSMPPSLPAGAQTPHIPPHPEMGIGPQMGALSLNAMGLEEALNGSGLTPDEVLDLLFDPAKIPLGFRESLPDQYHVRPLASDDFLRSHFALLGTLSPSPALAPSVYSALFRALQSCPDTYYIVVLVDRETDQVVASGTFIKERKFIHGGGFAGHIEDIVVGPSAQGRGLGQKLVVGLREMASELGCYKTILDCQEPKVPFYEKCGFTLRGRQMAYYVPKEAPPRRESLARTALASSHVSSHPPTPSRLRTPQEGPSDESDDDVDSIAETYTTGITGTGTDETFTNVSYRFPTSRGVASTLGPGVASTVPELGPSPSVGGPGDAPVPVADLNTPTGSIRSGSSGNTHCSGGGARPCPVPGMERGTYF